MPPHVEENVFGMSLGIAVCRRLVGRLATTLVDSYCQAQPKPSVNLAGLSLALFLISPTGRLATWTSSL